MITLTNLPQGLTIKTLSASHVPDVLALQNIIFAALPEDGKDFISLKTAQKLEERITTLGKMHGIFASTADGENLIAYGGVVFPTAAWPTADLALEPDRNLPYHHDELAVIQSCAVHPQHRGKGLHKYLIAVKEELCLRNGRPHIMSEVAAANPASLKGFLVQGYKVVFGGIAPNDKCKLLFLHKDASNGHAFSVNGKKTFPIDPVASFDLTREHLDQGSRGLSMQRGNGVKGYVLTLSEPVCA